MDLLNLIFLLLAIVCVKFLLRPDPPPVNNVYSQPNKWYWLKYGVFRLMLWLRKRQQHKEVTGQNAGMGRRSRNSPEDMDKVQVLPKEHPKVIIVCCFSKFKKKMKDKSLCNVRLSRVNCQLLYLFFLRVRACAQNLVM